MPQIYGILFDLSGQSDSGKIRDWIFGIALRPSSATRVQASHPAGQFAQAEVCCNRALLKVPGWCAGDRIGLQGRLRLAGLGGRRDAGRTEGARNCRDSLFDDGGDFEFFGERYCSGWGNLLRER